jgi:hypothetical protein
MSDPSVAKQFCRVVIPKLLSQGFVTDGAKRCSRVVGDIFQGVFLNVETRIRREFMIEYCAFLVCVPHTQYSLQHGGRFPVGSRGKWYGADTPERLEQSMTQVQAAIPALMDWFQASETLDGFLKTFTAHCATQPPRLVQNGHSSMTLACGAAARRDPHSAKLHAERALFEYEDALASFRQQCPMGEHWAPVCIERARALIAAVDGSATDALLAEWRALTTDALKIRAS